MSETPWYLRPLLYPGSGPSSVAENVAIRADLRADVYTPPAPERRPAVVLIHGGPVPPGASLKDLPMYRDYGRLLAGHGFVAVTFTHRYLAYNEFADAADDVQAVIDFVRAHPGVDPERVFLWAFSGGGPLLSLGLDKPYVRALVDYYAYLEAPAPYGLIARAAEIRVPMLIARCGKDMPYVNEQIDAFLPAAFAGGVALELLNHPAGEHGFDIVNDDARTREIIGRTLAFLGEH